MVENNTLTRAWDQHEAEQLAARLRLTYRQRLDWLWQAKRFAERARLAAEKRNALRPAPSPTSRDEGEK